ncbi:MAG: hypothetical protein DRI98_11960 [Bacteroidetes bacterium]|nr:MAG: hypothetical protein DRI98_11960 [Bacteroidota bacterium]
MGDVTDIGTHRENMRDVLEKDSVDDDSLLKCPTCRDVLFMIFSVPEYTDIVDKDGPYAIICQHCNNALGSAYVFNDEEEGET